jgi:hypothetical protein
MMANAVIAVCIDTVFEMGAELLTENLKAELLSFQNFLRAVCERGLQTRGAVSTDAWTYGTGLLHGAIQIMTIAQRYVRLMPVLLQLGEALVTGGLKRSFTLQAEQLLCRTYFLFFIACCKRAPMLPTAGFWFWRLPPPLLR